MILEYIIAVAVVCILMLNTVKIPTNGVDIVQLSMANTILLNKKLTAIQTNTDQDFIVEHQMIDGFTTPMNDCHLSWTSRGTASKSGTCRSKYGNTTNGLGEGGIGYYWE